ncbi:hypothetical protein ACLM5J_02930 [Nocardioides sp. Bht2]|uniref:hypothetical protein n=1 Tax=Nocardioides sp. Bht2 TaxID=3392297 RepID=UPI0039B42A50
MSSRQRAAALLAGALCAGTLQSAPAAADPSPSARADGPRASAAIAAPGSIVFIRDHNVWLARGDGTGAYRVTRDGTATAPYRSPSQSDTGVIAVSRRHLIIRMTQNGTMLNTIDPPPLVGGPNTPAGDVAISPDGRHIAYSLIAHQCDLGTPGCRPSVASSVTRAETPTPATTYGITPHWSPSWASNTRLLASGGYLYQIMVKDLGSAPVHWFDDHELSNVPPGASTDLSDAELSPDGTRLAAVRGWGDDTRITWYEVIGDPRVGAPPGPPVWTCMTSALDGLSSPSWAPDSLHFAWQEPDGIWATTAAQPCTDPTRIIPNASEPDWSAAPLAPAPRRLEASGRPTVKGTARVGRRLTSRSPLFTPSAQRIGYRWLCNSNPIRSATTRNYRLTRKDRGCRIQLRITASRNGHLSVTVTSPATRKVRR